MIHAIKQSKNDRMVTMRDVIAPISTVTIGEIKAIITHDMSNGKINTSNFGACFFMIRNSLKKRIKKTFIIAPENGDEKR